MVLVTVKNHVLHVCHALHVKRTIMKHSLVRNRRTVNVRRVCLVVMGILIFLANAAVLVHLNVFLVKNVQLTSTLCPIAIPADQTVFVATAPRLAFCVAIFPLVRNVFHLLSSIQIHNLVILRVLRRNLLTLRPIVSDALPIVVFVLVPVLTNALNA